MPKLLDKWGARFVDLAQTVSEWSKDPSTRVGAVIVRDRRVVSTGYNGFAPGVEDTEVRLNDRELKYKFTVHSERAAIYNAAKHGVALGGAEMYVFGLPCCSDCANAIISSGIKKVTMVHGPMKPKWRDSFEYTKLFFSEAGVEWDCIECVEVGAGLPEGPHRVEGHPGIGDEPVDQPKAYQERDIRQAPGLDDQGGGTSLGLL